MERHIVFSRGIEMEIRLHIGMRKIKSLISVTLSFFVWQLIRIFLPMLEIHPIFAYIYAVIEMRENPEKTKSFGKLRIKATFIGLITGLAFVTLSIFLLSLISSSWARILVEFALILFAVLFALCISEMFGCKNFCGIAAIIAVICMVSHSGEDKYLYAIMRVLQTLIGVFSATIVNTFINKKQKKEKTDE